MTSNMLEVRDIIVVLREGCKEEISLQYDGAGSSNLLPISLISELGAISNMIET